MTTYDLIVDFDDVIYPWSQTAHEICERAGITNGNEIDCWEFWRSYGCEEREVWDVLGEATISRELYVAEPIPGAIEQLERIQSYGHRLHIVTARGFGQHGETVKEATHEHVEKWAVPHDSLHFEKDKTKVAGEFAIDDGLHNYYNLLDDGRRPFLMDTPHNQSDKTAWRVRSMREFADIILSVMWVM